MAVPHRFQDRASQATKPGPGDSWETGGGPTWVTGSFDPKLNLVYWGTGNPAPDWNGDVRMGDNLYASSVIALDADTGKLKWHFQFTPHDVHDWDAVQIPVLVDAEFRGRQRKLMYWGNRNAFFYVLDRETGEYSDGEALHDPNLGRAYRREGPAGEKAEYQPEPRGGVGFARAAGWHELVLTSYSPVTKLFYLSVWDFVSRFLYGRCALPAGRAFLWQHHGSARPTSRDAARSGRWIRPPARSGGSIRSSACRRPAFSRQAAILFLAALRKDNSSRWMTRPGRSCGAPIPEA